MGYREQDFLALSGLQHYFYCKRQWALIEVERQWIENIFTAEGRLLHDRVDEKFKEYKEDVIIERSVSLRSKKLGIYGVADVVEFYKSDRGIKLPQEQGLWLPKPVEYKRGKPKENICDKAQLCCQAMCLEELFEIEIENGYLFYWQIRRKIPVVFDEYLRKAVINACEDMHYMIENGITPEIPEKVKCKNCSMLDVCIPDVLKRKKGKVTKYIYDNIHRNEDA